MRIRAWGICSDRTAADGALLVFAPTRNRARYLASQNGTWGYDDWRAINARRAPDYDGAFDIETVCDTNDDIPANYSPFYCDDEDEPQP